MTLITIRTNVKIKDGKLIFFQNLNGVVNVNVTLQILATGTYRIKGH